MASRPPPAPTLAELRAMLLCERKTIPREPVEPPPGLLYVDSVEDGAWLYGHALTLGLEGVVGKRAGSTYRSGKRSRDWLTVKRPGAVPPGRFSRSVA
ncbi:hypothetical protein [Cupriavidus taiwanensis]|uniref:ATP-dependent DNA ligase n=1 Tax=Cupriavidus TaxID=106589 RepID=UPI000E14311C|nr:hypothetical protein [Cupriavidus taiwanensis]SPA23997.1 conserved hypothetical protein [Cupriavidus taiwanensis]